MCTVSFLPLSKNEFLLTSNRDEDIARATALPINAYAIKEQTVFYPKDPKANGTWIAHSEKGFTLCLLNGAFKQHSVKSNYKKSRGLVLLDFFNYNSINRFTNEYDFNNIEPFTLIIVKSCEINNSILLYELKWDEFATSLKQIDSSMPHIWSSVTLYTESVMKNREQWFNDWLNKNPNYTKDEILFFHHFAGDNSNDNSLMINRSTKKTVSVTCIYKTNAITEMIYEDIINQKLYKNKIISC